MKRAPQTISWYKNAVIYQVYPRSFKDANGDGMGDLRGIIEKLDYLNDGTGDSLQVDAIWISPIYASPMKDMGYDITDHCAIDPTFGTLEDFDELVREAHARGIRIIMDYVANHTSDQHPWFLESRSSKENPKRDWYIWHEAKGGGIPNNWQSVFGGSIWEWDQKTHEYYLHQFLKEQPDLNWKNPNVRSAMRDILRFWIDRGVDGFRVDAMNHVYEDRFFRDDPPRDVAHGTQIETPKSMLLYSVNRPEIRNVVSMLCNVAETYPNTFFVTESFFDANQMLTIYNQCGEVMPFNFNLISLPWDTRHYKTFIDHFDKAVPDGKIPNYVLGNHDQSRVASRHGVKRARLSAMLQLTLRGTAFIYNGEELGMHDVPIPEDRIQDGAARQWDDNAKSRDPSRTPMQWGEGPYAEFSKVEPWLPVASDYEAHNVRTEGKDPTSFLNLYRALTNLRRHSPALRYGGYEPIAAQASSILSYRRIHDGEEYAILLNFSEEHIEEQLPFSHGEVICSSSAPLEKREVISKLSLEPLEGYLVRKIR